MLGVSQIGISEPVNGKGQEVHERASLLGSNLLIAKADCLHKLPDSFGAGEMFDPCLRQTRRALQKDDVSGLACERRRQIEIFRADLDVSLAVGSHRRFVGLEFWEQFSRRLPETNLI